MQLETWERTRRGGLVGLGTGPRVRRVAENLSKAVVYVLGGSAVLAVLQGVAGLHPAPAW